jgi:hypothetical protein
MEIVEKWLCLPVRCRFDIPYLSHPESSAMVDVERALAEGVSVLMPLPIPVCREHVMDFAPT